MIKIAKELNKVIDNLEQMGFLTEASDIHSVFVKVAQMGSVPGYQGTMGSTGNYQVPQTVADAAAQRMNPQTYQGNPQNYQRLIAEYKQRLYQEAQSSTDATLPLTSDFFKQIMIGNQLTDQEKQAFRAQAYRIRQEAQVTGYGKRQPQQGQLNLPLMVENAVKQSGIMRITDPQKLENSKVQVFNSLSQQIMKSVPQQQQQQYLQYARNILQSYLNNRSATLGVQAIQQGQQPQQPGAQQSPLVSPM